MARIRTIKPELLTDEKTGVLPDDAWRVFVSVLLLADDYGNFRAHPSQVSAAIFWARETLPNVSGILAKLAGLGLIALYEHDGQRYGHVNGWDKHQRVDHPGKPLCPQYVPGSSRESRETLAKIPETLAPDLIRSDLSGSEGIGSDLTLSCSEPGGPARELELFSRPVVLNFPCNGIPAFWDLTQGQVDEWQAVYPGLDIAAQARYALAWIKANPTKRKTAGGMARFLVSWMGRANDKGSPRGGAPGAFTANPRIGHVRAEDMPVPVKSGRQEI